jgi:universal stress protein A
MYRNILIPVDLSPENDPAVTAAGRLADPDGAAITLLHVVETLQDETDDELERFYDRLRERAERTLRRWTEELSQGGVEARSEVLYGKRAREILGFAEEHDIDLIVLASHAVDRDHPVESFGTLSHQVALLAPCPVLLVR